MKLKSLLFWRDTTILSLTLAPHAHSGLICFVLFFFGGGVSVRRVLLFPKGNNVDHLSIYLDVADSPTLPYGWSRFAHFSLAVVNQYDPKITVKKGAPLLMHLCFVSKRESLVLF